MPRPGPRPYECIRRAWHSDSHQPLRGSLTQEIFRVVTEFHSAETRSKKEWQEKLPIVVLRAEDILYSKARTEAEYTDLSTLKHRLEDAVNTMIRRTDDRNDKDGPYMEPCVEAALSLGCTPKTNPRGQRSCTARLASVSNVKRASPSTSSKEASTVNQNQNVASYLMSTTRADMESGNAAGKPTVCAWPKPMAQGPLPFPQLVAANNVYNMNGGYPSTTVQQQQQQQQQHVRSSPVVRPEFRDELKGSQFVSMTPFNHGSFGMVCPQPLDPALSFRLQQQQQQQQQQYSLNRDEVIPPSVCFEAAAEPAKARNNSNPFEPLRPLCCPVTKYSGAAPFQANSLLPSIFPNLSTTLQRQSGTIPADCIRSQREVAEADLELCLAPPKTSFHQSRVNLDVAESCTTSSLSWQSEGLNSLLAGADAAGLACSKRKPLPIGAAGKCYDSNIEIFEANKRHREFPY